MNRLWKKQHRKFDKGARPSMFLNSTGVCGTPSYVGTTAANRAAKRETKRPLKAEAKAEMVKPQKPNFFQKIFRTQGR